MRLIVFTVLVLAGCSHQIDSSNNSQKMLSLTCSKNELNDMKFYAFQQKCIASLDEMNSGKNPQKTDWVKVVKAEGQEHAALNWKFLKEKYGKFLSPAYNDWLKHLDETERIVEDAVLLIEPDELRKHIIYLEDFVEKNENFIAITDVKSRLNWYLNIYLNGVDNSPVYDRKNCGISPKFRTSYERFLRKNKKSKYFRMVQQRSNRRR